MKKETFWKEELPSDLFLENLYRFFASKLVEYFSFLPLSANILTLLRIPLGVMIFFLLAFSEYYLVLFVLMVLWKFVDKVDGAWARGKKQESRFGAWFDVVVDRVFWGMAMLGLTIAVYKNVSNILPWFLLAVIFLGHTLFQNFTYLGKGIFEEELDLDWSQKASDFGKNSFSYQIIFSIYYLWDQVLALALISYIPARSYLSIDTLLLTLVLFSLFFTGATFYVIYLQFNRLISRKI